MGCFFADFLNNEAKHCSHELNCWNSVLVVKRVGGKRFYRIPQSMNIGQNLMLFKCCLEKKQIWGEDLTPLGCGVRFYRVQTPSRTKTLLELIQCNFRALFSLAHALLLLLLLIFMEISAGFLPDFRV